MFFKVSVLKKFCNIHKKNPVALSLKKIAEIETATQTFSFEYCEFFGNSFFHKTPPVAVSLKKTVKKEWDPCINFNNTVFVKVYKTKFEKK